MNINLIAVALDDKGNKDLQHRFTGAVEFVENIFPSNDSQELIREDVALYNSNRVTGTWIPETWIDFGDKIVSVSQPPIPVTEEVSSDSYPSFVNRVVDSKTFQEFLPNHFGISLKKDGDVTIWADTLGIGRCYYVRNKNYVAASNHIGVLSFFLDGPVEVDTAAVSRYSGAGWFMENDSPIRGINRLRESKLIEVSRERHVKLREYGNFSDLLCQRDHVPDYQAAVNEMQLVAKNLAALSVRTSTVYLSGGRDSRMTAGLWLSAGNDARVMTLGTLSREAEIAQYLMSLYEPSRTQQVQHDVRVAKSSDVTQSLEDRLERAFQMWDGDAAPGNMKRNVSIPSGSAALAIGGVGGEIMHGYYYLRPGQIESVQKLENPLDQARRSFGFRSMTQEAAEELVPVFDRAYKRAIELGRSDIAALDYFYMTEKMRRWGNQALTSHSAIMLSSPTYVRACFDLKPIQRVQKVFPERVAEIAMPQWAGVEIYKAEKSDSRTLMRKGLTSFQTDPDKFHSFFDSPDFWPNYLDEETIRGYLEIAETDQGLPTHESWLNRAIWIEYLHQHVAELNLITAPFRMQRLGNEAASINASSEAGSVENTIETGETVACAELLRTGVLRKQLSDPAKALELISGQVKIGDSVLQLENPDLYDAAKHEKETFFLAFHSFRWLTPTLNGCESESDGRSVRENAWTRWWISNQQSTVSDRVWNLIITLQRSSVLALSVEKGDTLPKELIIRHIEALRRLLGTVSSFEDAQQAVVALMILARATEDGNVVDRVGVTNDIQGCLSRFIRNGGGVYGSDLEAMLEGRAQVNKWLSIVDPSNSFAQALRDSLLEKDFWVHLHTPSGALNTIGSNLGSADWITDDPELQYIRSNGTLGSPPRDVRFLDKYGLISGRSGWGETERNLKEETYWSMLVGQVRGKSSHEDVGRIIYSSQGIDWIVDPAEEAMRGSKDHSVITLPGQRYRYIGDVEVIRSETTDQIDDYVVRGKTWLPTQWTRQVAFVRTGYYLVVVDRLRASKAFNAVQSWIINPEVEVAPEQDGVLLQKDGKKVRLQVSGNVEGSLQVEKVLGASGEKIATRLNIPVSGQSARLITVIMDVRDVEVQNVQRLPSTGHDLAFRVVDRQIDELLVMTPEGCRIVPSTLDANSAIEQAKRILASGELSDEESLTQRLETHAKIVEVKSSIWAENGSLESRREAVQELKRFIAEYQIVGLVDHGIAAALIDIAGQDLMGDIQDVSIVHNHRRTPLINWTSDPMKQMFYQFPLHTTRTPNHVPEIESTSAIWSVDLGEVVASSLIMDAPGDTLVVYFHGATDRTRHAMPRYERIRSFSSIGEGPVMYFSDGTLDLDSRNILSWYIGTELMNLHEAMACMIKAYAEQRGVNHVVLVGNSGGGFTAVQTASYLKGADAICVNGQIDLSRYQPRIAEPALRASFGLQYGELKPELVRRANVIERLSSIEFDLDALFYQNSGDDHHMEEHYRPLMEKYEASSAKIEGRLNSEVVYLGDGHVAPGVDEYVQIVRDRIKNIKVGNRTFDGLR